jgi:hypothetical protein
MRELTDPRAIHDADEIIERGKRRLAELDAEIEFEESGDGRIAPKSQKRTGDRGTQKHEHGPSGIGGSL